MNIPEIYNNYDNKLNKYQHLLHNTNLNVIKSPNELNFSTYTIKSLDTDEVIATGECSIIGLYNIKTFIWYWGWFLLSYNKIETYMSRKLLLYALDMSVNSISEDVLIQLTIKSELLTSKLLLKYPEIELEKYIAIALYLTQSDFYYKSNLEIIDGEPNAFVYYLLHTVN